MFHLSEIEELALVVASIVNWPFHSCKGFAEDLLKAGYKKSNTTPLVPLDRTALAQVIVQTDSTVNNFKIADAIVNKFGTRPAVTEDVPTLLKEWLTFSEDVGPGDAAGADWLDALTAKTERMIKELEAK